MDTRLDVELLSFDLPKGPKLSILALREDVIEMVKYSSLGEGLDEWVMVRK